MCIRDRYLAARPSRTNGLITIMRVCQQQRRHLWESLRQSLSVPPFTRALLKSPSSRGLSAIAELSELLVLFCNRVGHFFDRNILVLVDMRIWCIFANAFLYMSMLEMSAHMVFCVADMHDVTKC